MEDETLIAYGGAVKALGNGRVGGYLVTFGDATTPDLSDSRDFFDAATDYAVDLPGAKSTVLYHHGLDGTMGKRRIGRGEMKMDNVGVWIEAQLSVRDEYERAVYKLAEEGKLGWSSGTANHLVEREPVKNADGKVIANRITHWPLGLDASLTPNPAEPRCHAVALKSLEAVPSLQEAVGEIKAAQEAHLQISPLLGGFGKAGDQLTLSQHSEAVASAVEGYCARLETRYEARIKSGRELSSRNVDEIEEVRGSLAALQDRLAALLSKAAPKQSESEVDEPAPESTGDQAALNAMALYADVQQTLAQVLTPAAG